MDPKDFLALFTSKTIFKDASPRIPSMHGMWSHTIQIWSIYHRNLQVKFLQHAPMEIYQALGKLGADVWDSIFDKGPDDSTFSSPGTVTSSIKNSFMQRPLLNGTIQRQYDKSNFPVPDIFDFFKPPPPTTAYETHLIKKHGEDFKKGYVKSGL